MEPDLLARIHETVTRARETRARVRQDRLRRERNDERERDMRETGTVIPLRRTRNDTRSSRDSSW